MATSSFDKELIINDEKTVEKLLDMLENGTSVEHDVKSVKSRELDAEKIKRMIDKHKTKKGCKHCEEGKDLMNESHNGLVKYIWIESNKLWIEIHVEDTGKSYIDSRIVQFCPMCGRKLDILG